MAFSPLSDNFEDTSFVTEDDVLPSKTYALDLDTGAIGPMVDGTAALKQFILKAIATERFHYTVYDTDYGCELEDLIGSNVTAELLTDEIPRVITEALIYDDRIDDVYDFVTEQSGDKVYVSFYVDTNQETIPIEVVL
ncbi:DUF2634 domain-containing protein [Paenibacillus wulumuqiensis]|uniref:DUF2634 domain-containing protein n=1 Tax=Paenibacillus wulumuqiensis TaxID=1567107 RepID=UPI00061905AD|nr:DUF2634 domain-containing protein [Paenibacillus wulumuqiensis]